MPTRVKKATVGILYEGHFNKDEEWSQRYSRGGEVGKNGIADSITILEQPWRDVSSIHTTVLVRCKCQAASETELAQQGNNDSFCWDALPSWLHKEVPCGAACCRHSRGT